ncbi:DNA-binding response regulator [Aurantimonas sp. 22II-16-19i]|uniref:response regulator transcription factor n=1 Tax=Aurantimonas sp. 22II-16-19i TaxID=1317114 RepID=UPI0009F7B5E7|nr:DNA-binding response regulator [Aurantimonas sp. 22II-16-19i]ORE98421.1 two component LuxR family transcriptional regulator [Aurantimonas sp. 22II-16-19i]
MEPERPDGRLVVLAVEDSPEAAAFIVAALEAEGMTVLVATDSARALSIIERVTPDVILMDAMMPGTDGFETSRRIKASGNFADIPIIFMTGLSETEHIVRAFAVGGVDYVTKPIRPEELVARIGVHSQNARMSRSARLALETTGRYLFATDGAGELLWATRQARQLLAEEAGAREAALAIPAGRLRIGATLPLSKDLSLTVVGRLGSKEFLLRITRDGMADDIETLQRQLQITAREAEVLLWLARGKPNRDIAEILKLSPRTVNKHLEVVFRKLGVENRAAATAIAVRQLSDNE